MIGLKLFLRDFANINDDGSFDAFYERQRELVRCGLLPVRGGRGPGSGVPLTAETLATFLIGLLATDGLADVGIKTKQLCDAKPMIIGPKGWAQRKGRTFHADLSRALLGSTITGFQPGDDLHANLYAGVLVTRHWRGVLMQNRELENGKNQRAEGMQGIEYVVSEEERLASPIISHTASIEMEPWWTLCLRLREALKIEKKER
jgi:hypothetical protein